MTPIEIKLHFTNGWESMLSISCPIGTVLIAQQMKGSYTSVFYTISMEIVKYKNYQCEDRQKLRQQNSNKTYKWWQKQKKKNRES